MGRLIGRGLRATGRGLTRVLGVPEQAAGRVGVWLVTTSLVLAIVALASIPVMFAVMAWFSVVKTLERIYRAGPSRDDAIEFYRTSLQMLGDYASLLVIGVVAAVVATALLGWAWKAWAHHPDASDTP